MANKKRECDPLPGLPIFSFMAALFVKAMCKNKGERDTGQINGTNTQTEDSLEKEKI